VVASSAAAGGLKFLEQGAQSRARDLEGVSIIGQFFDVSRYFR